MTEQRDIVWRLEEVRRRVADMCKEHRGPRMTIPADRERDDDLFICDAARDAQAEIERLRAQVATADQENERLRGENFRIAETLSEYAKEYEERRLPGERVPTHDAAGNKLPTPSEWFGRDAPPESSAKEPS